MVVVRRLLEAVLPQSESAALRLRFLEDRTVEEIAIELRIQKSAVYKRIVRGVRKLRQYLERYPECIQSLSA
jgi:DNA-directed RNA polymerase specialized sigma24 family protein